MVNIINKKLCTRQTGLLELVMTWISTQVSIKWVPFMEVTIITWALTTIFKSHQIRTSSILSITTELSQAGKPTPLKAKTVNKSWTCKHFRTYRIFKRWTRCIYTISTWLLNKITFQSGLLSYTQCSRMKTRSQPNRQLLSLCRHRLSQLRFGLLLRNSLEVLSMGISIEITLKERSLQWTWGPV